MFRTPFTVKGTPQRPVSLIPGSCVGFVSLVSKISPTKVGLPLQSKTGVMPSPLNTGWLVKISVKFPKRSFWSIVKMGNDNRATERAAKLVLLVGGCCLGRVVKVISTIQFVVS